MASSEPEDVEGRRREIAERNKKLKGLANRGDENDAKSIEHNLKRKGRKAPPPPPEIGPFPFLETVGNTPYSWDVCWSMGLEDSPYKVKDASPDDEPSDDESPDEESPDDEPTIYQFIQDVLKLDVMQSERMAKKGKRIEKLMAPPVGKRKKEVCFFEDTPKDEAGVDKVLKPLVISIGGVDLPHYTVFDILGFLMVVAANGIDKPQVDEEKGKKEKKDNAKKQATKKPIDETQDYSLALLSLYCHWTRRLVWEFVGQTTPEFAFWSDESGLIPSMHSVIWNEKGSMVLGSTVPSGILEPRLKPKRANKKSGKAKDRAADGEDNEDNKGARKNMEETDGNKKEKKKTKKGSEKAEVGASDGEGTKKTRPDPEPSTGTAVGRPTFGKKSGKTKATIQESRAYKILVANAKKGTKLDLESADAYPMKLVDGKPKRKAAQLFGNCAESNEFIWYPLGIERSGGGAVYGLAMEPWKVAEDVYRPAIYAAALRDPCVNCCRLLSKIVGNQEGDSDESVQQTVLEYFGIVDVQKRVGMFVTK